MNEPILIIAAMEDIELNYLKEILENAIETEYKSFKFIEGKINGKKLVLCVSNIGLINAAIATTIGIEKYKPKVVINEGIAGGYSKNIHNGDFVIGVDAINITSMEYKGTGNTLNDYEITNFLYGEENRLIRKTADKKIIEFIKENFTEYKLHFRKYCKWRYME